MYREAAGFIGRCWDGGARVLLIGRLALGLCSMLGLALRFTIDSLTMTEWPSVDLAS